MNRVQLPERLRSILRSTAIYLTAILVICSSLVALQVTPANAIAANDCLKWNAVPYTYSNLLSADQATVNQCKSAGYCLLKSTDQAAGTTTLSCTDVASDAILAAAASNSAAAELKPVLTLVCGTGPSGVGDTLLTLYQSCISTTVKAYASCNETGGSITSSMQDTSTNTAKCMMPKLPDPKPQAGSLITAIDSGRSAAAGITDQAIGTIQQTAEKAKCDDRIKNGEAVQWNGSACVASTDTKPACAVEGIGWIVCPVVTFLTNLNEKAFAFLSSNFLETPSSIFDNATLKSAWGNFQSIANLLFVVGFIAIIYSQISGRGVNNYSIKKILPRLFIAAILINASFLICQIAVDVSNLLGYNLFKFATSLPVTGSAPAVPNAWSEVGASILQVGAGIGLIALIFLAPTVLIAVAIILLILIARQALVIILIAIAPIAFAAYLLPNTEDWFKKWYKAFAALLLVFPIIALVFGGATMASTVLMGVANDTTKTTDAESKNTMMVVAAAALGLPLFAVPALLSASFKGLGSVGARLSGATTSAGGKITGAPKAARASDRYKNSALGQYGLQRKKQAEVNRALAQGGHYKGNNIFRKGQNFVSRGINSATPGRFGERRSAVGEQLAAKEANEETERQQASLSGKNANELLAIGMDSSNSAEKRAAAFRQLEHVGGHQHIQQAYDYLMKEGSSGGKDIKDVQQLSAKSLLSRRPAGVGKTQANALVSGTMAGEGYNDSLRQRLRDKKFDGRSLAAMDVDDLARFAQMKADGSLSDTDSQMLDALHQQMLADPTLSLSGEQQHALDQAIYGSKGTPATDVHGNEYKLTNLSAPVEP